ncbi:MAG: fumarylacetoacetate hydrolase family protein [Actinomycetota bacterium]
MSDGRIERGLGRQLAERQRLLDGGQTHLGWKAGFGSASILEKFDLDGPLVGFMTSASVVADGSVVDIGGWQRPVAEPELAVWVDRDVPAGGDEEQVRACISALAPAIELADVYPPPEDVEEVLAANVFHRGVILGEADPHRRGAHLDGLEPGSRLDSQEVEAPADLEALTGRLPSVVSHLAALLADRGETIAAGDVVICGSVVPPLSLSPGATAQFQLAPFPALTVHTT